MEINGTLYDLKWFGSLSQKRNDEYKLFIAYHEPTHDDKNYWLQVAN